ncbi:hypothetical protein [Acidovorax sp. NCPPB 4044]|uniref:hypothetical protein n=1 Tax=Acidovorax sp. NCPPB 4044 TaxID=2940490 RepID=UPI00230498F0|nr:hypothetical protein [Acidovorax sp. NCPPB 4044]MDA8522336.1 hypothetical protein [Acidovorax sp. NCPPB 4044]
MSAPIQIFGPYRAPRLRRARRALLRALPVLGWLLALIVAYALPPFLAGVLLAHGLVP